MPYITREDRKRVSETGPDTPGDLNFMITKLVDYYLNKKGVKYSTINEAIGVLECAKLELYRRIAVPYEDQKLLTNGDVYSCATTSQDR